ncbi:unnamed protein product [Acanthoscelides obtectus]|uniref:Uncharacterized protein n=1 Tax=Acanthoscelides obtectus TaxID=200917 RepID=A0A9P0VP79_ACAOB|nr:unnamed protein product [Acanthoscelides obtectus]CAK1667898.1 hypothetical protein AOBTE_LOCUS26098 [Acanthoscelides obtectus]
MFDRNNPQDPSRLRYLTIPVSPKFYSMTLLLERIPQIQPLLSKMKIPMLFWKINTLKSVEVVLEQNLTI